MRGSQVPCPTGSCDERTAASVFLLAVQRGLPRAHRPEPEGPDVTKPCRCTWCATAASSTARVTLRANPQQLVPTLMHGVRVIRQSLAILEYLDEAWPSPRLLPMTARDRAAGAGLAQLVACDIHPLNNLRVLQFFEHTWRAAVRARRLGQALDRRRLRRVRSAAGARAADRRFLRRRHAAMADCCLVPQLYNARRFGIGLDPYPRIRQWKNTGYQRERDHLRQSARSSRKSGVSIRRLLVRRASRPPGTALSPTGSRPGPASDRSADRSRSSRSFQEASLAGTASSRPPDPRSAQPWGRRAATTRRLRARRARGRDGRAVRRSVGLLLDPPRRDRSRMKRADADAAAP